MADTAKFLVRGQRALPLAHIRGVGRGFQKPARSPRAGNLAIGPAIFAGTAFSIFHTEQVFMKRVGPGTPRIGAGGILSGTGRGRAHRQE